MFWLNSSRNSCADSAGSSPGIFPCGQKQTSKASSIWLEVVLRAKGVLVDCSGTAVLLSRVWRRRNASSKIVKRPPTTGQFLQ